MKTELQRLIAKLRDYEREGFELSQDDFEETNFKDEETGETGTHLVAHIVMRKLNHD